jgi:hypothetical protein
MIVILFMEKTWFLWWVFAIVVIVRWFHLLSMDTESALLDSLESAHRQSHIDSDDLASRTADSLYV